MDSWWQLGEGSGQHGAKLAVYQIVCAFCLERGNFKTVFHAEKKKPNGSKVLNFDTLECGNCSGYVLVLWSATQSLGSQGLHDYHVLPWPLRVDRYPDHWPEAVGRYWLQAQRNLADENWDAAALMARSALQVAMREHKANGKTLKQEVDDLARKGILPPLMKEWSDNVRELGNDSAHPDPAAAATSQQDARDVVRFLRFLLEYLYNLPHDIAEYRKRREAL
jgi:hypothetical protein